jgi:hypothetical protein
VQDLDPEQGASGALLRRYIESIREDVAGALWDQNASSSEQNSLNQGHREWLRKTYRENATAAMRADRKEFDRVIQGLQEQDQYTCRQQTRLEHYQQSQTSYHSFIEHLSDVRYYLSTSHKNVTVRKRSRAARLGVATGFALRGIFRLRIWVYVSAPCLVMNVPQIALRAILAVCRRSSLETTIRHDVRSLFLFL